MSKFKPGDLAIITGCIKDPVNVGRVCELVQIVTYGDVTQTPLGRQRYVGKIIAWLCVAKGLRAGFIDSSGKYYASDVGFTYVAERFLTPLRGDFEPEAKPELIEAPACS